MRENYEKQTPYILQEEFFLLQNAFVRGKILLKCMEFVFHKVSASRNHHQAYDRKL
jgi:hypothetical protein